MSQAPLVNSDGRVVEEAKIDKLKSNLGGKVFRQGEEGYETSRRIFNALIDKHPGIIVQCTGAADVIEAVNFARGEMLVVAVKGGGHNVAGKSLCDGGLVIDLSQMKSVRVDPAAKIARVEPGVRLGEFDHETQGFGLATTTGIVSNTGISGLTLGGGLGWLNGRFGLACDNLVSADVVGADGQLRIASPDENRDLFWGLRGGGGNLGVVTSFQYRLHALGPVLGGMVLHDLGKAREVLRFYDDFAHDRCPDELSTAAAMLTSPEGKPLIAILACYSGPDLDEGEKVLRPLRTFGPPLADSIKRMKYVEMQRLLDEGSPLRVLNYWKSNFLRRGLSQEAIDTLSGQAVRKPSSLTALVLQQMHGAASRVAAEETAFPHRHQQYDMIIASGWLEPKDTERNIRWTRETWEAMQPFVERGVYVNNLMEEGSDRVKDAYGSNYERLSMLKAKYDPSNLFSVNHNVAPKAPGR